MFPKENAEKLKWISLNSILIILICNENGVWKWFMELPYTYEIVELAMQVDLFHNQFCKMCILISEHRTIFYYACDESIYFR